MRVDNGLFVTDLPDGKVQAVGYVINFAGHGSFSPDGKEGEFTDAEVYTHNNILAQIELEELKRDGKGILYLSRSKSSNGQYSVTQWNGNVIAAGVNVSSSWHNLAGERGRRDVHFTFDSSMWHGVNIGDNQILRVKRLKSK